MRSLIVSIVAAVTAGCMVALPSPVVHSGHPHGGGHKVFEASPLGGLEVSLSSRLPFPASFLPPLSSFTSPFASVVTVASAAVVALPDPPQIFSVVNGGSYNIFPETRNRGGVVGNYCLLGLVRIWLYSYLPAYYGSRFTVADPTLDYGVSFVGVTFAHYGLWVEAIPLEIADTTGFGRVVVNVQHSVFRANGPVGNKYSGTVLLLRGQLTKGSVVTVVNNTFEGYITVAPRQDLTQWFYGCSAMDIGFTTFAEDSTVTIERNTLSNFGCHHQRWYYGGPLTGRSNAPILIGRDDRPTTVDHGTTINILNNTAGGECFNFNRSINCLTSTLFIGTLHLETGTTVNVHRNDFLGRRIDARQLIFTERKAGDVRPAGVLSVQKNTIRRGGSPDYAFIMAPTAAPSQSVDIYFRQSTSEGGVVYFDDNIVDGYELPVRIQFPSGTNRTFQPTSPYLLSIKGNSFGGRGARTPITLMGSDVDVEGSVYDISNNRYQLHPTNATALLHIGSATAKSITINMANNVGTSDATSDLKINANHKLITAWSYLDFDEEFANSLVICNNTINKIPLEGAGEYQTALGLGDVAERMYCYKCKCRIEGDGVGAADGEGFCDANNQPYCCSLSPSLNMTTKCLDVSTAFAPNPALSQVFN